MENDIDVVEFPKDLGNGKELVIMGGGDYESA